MGLKGNEETRYQLEQAFKRLNLPVTGIQRGWLQEVEELNELVQCVLAVHGFEGAKMVEEQIRTLKPTGKGAWIIRGVLTELSLTISQIEDELRDFVTAESACPENPSLSCDGRLGLWIWHPHDNSALWDTQFYDLLGFPPSQRATFEGYLSLFVHQTEAEQLQKAIQEILDGKAKGFTNIHLIQRPVDGKQRRIFLRAERHITSEGKMILSGYIRDVTMPCVIVTENQVRPCISPKASITEPIQILH